MRTCLIFARRSLVLMLVLVTILAPAAVRGQSCASYEQTMRFVGAFPAIPTPELVQADGGWVYTCGGGTFVVVDVTSPAAPVLHGSLGGLGTVADFVVAGGRAYLARGSAGLAVIDLSDAAHPSAAGTLVLPTSATAIGLYGALVVVAGEGSFYLVDPTTPDAMAIVGQTTTVDATDLAVVGSYALVTSATGIATIDLATPSAPAQVALFVAVCSGGACEYADPVFRGISVEGDRALVRGGKWVWDQYDPHWGAYRLRPWLWVLDINDPAAVLRFSDRQVNASAILLRAGHAVAIDTNELCLCSDESLALEGWLETGLPAPTDLGWHGDHLYAAEGAAGLAVFDVTYPGTVLPVSTYGASYEPFHSRLSGRYDLTFGNAGSMTLGCLTGWHLWDLSDPLHPTQPLWGLLADWSGFPEVSCVGQSDGLLAIRCWENVASQWYSVYDMEQDVPARASIDFDGQMCSSLKLVGKVAWVETDSRYELYDCSALPACPQIGQLTDPPGRLQVNGGACFLDPTTLVLTALDLSDPTTPVTGGSLTLPDSPRSLEIREGLAYLLYAGRLQIADLTNPLSPRLIGDLSGIINASTMTVTADILVLQTSSCFQVVSVAEPANPRLLSPVVNTIPNGAIGAAVISGNRMYQGSGSGVSVYDLTNPACPRFLGLGTSAGGRVFLHMKHIMAPGAVYPLDCDDPLPAFFSDFHVTRADRQVLVHWRSRGAAADFRVEASRGDETWDVPITVQDDQLTACDSSARLSAGGEVTYTVLARLDGQWSQIAQETVALGGVPAAVRLTGASPNPFNPRTTVAFALDRPREIELAVYDLRGRRLAVLASGRWDTGEHRLTWDGLGAGGAPLASGEYLLRLDADGGAVVRAAKVTLLR